MHRWEWKRKSSA